MKTLTPFLTFLLIVSFAQLKAGVLEIGVISREKVSVKKAHTSGILIHLCRYNTLGAIKFRGNIAFGLKEKTEMGAIFSYPDNLWQEIANGDQKYFEIQLSAQSLDLIKNRSDCL